MSKDPLFNAVVNKIVETIFVGVEYTDANGNRQEPAIKPIVDKIISELDLESLKLKVQQKIKDQYMDELVTTIVVKLRNGLYEQDYQGKVKFCDFVAKGLEGAITNALTNDQEFKTKINESINLDSFNIEVKVAKKETV